MRRAMAARASVVIQPHDLDAEIAALGAVLHGGAAVLRALGGLPDYALYKEGHRAIYNAMRRLTARGEPVDVITVQAELVRVDELGLAGGPAALALLLEQGSIAAYAPKYARIIADHAKTREYNALGQRLLSANGDGPAIIRDAEARTRALEAPTAAVAPTEWTALRAHRFPPRVDYIGHGILPKCSVMVVGGMTFLGKSALCYNLMAQRARGRPFLGHPTDPGVTLSLSAEIKLPGIQERLTMMLGDEPNSIPEGALHFRDERGVKLDTPAGYDRIAGWVQDTGATILHVDPIAKYMSTDENSGLAMGRVVDALESLADRFELGVIAVHHEGHANRESGRTGFDRLRGHTALASAADTVLMLSKDGDSYRLEWQLRHARTPEPMRLTRDANLWYHPAGLSDEDEALAKIVSVISLTHDGLVGAIKEDAQVSESTAKRRLKSALASGAIAKDGRLYVAGPAYQGSRVHEGSLGD
jgi:AAA domain-containing protein/DnaB helicase-like protein